MLCVLYMLLNVECAESLFRRQIASRNVASFEATVAIVNVYLSMWIHCSLCNCTYTLWSFFYLRTCLLYVA